MGREVTLTPSSFRGLAANPQLAAAFPELFAAVVAASRKASGCARCKRAETERAVDAACAHALGLLAAMPADKLAAFKAVVGAESVVVSTGRVVTKI